MGSNNIRHIKVSRLVIIHGDEPTFFKWLRRLGNWIPTPGGRLKGESCWYLGGRLELGSSGGHGGYLLGGSRPAEWIKLFMSSAIYGGLLRADYIRY